LLLSIALKRHLNLSLILAALLTTSSTATLGLAARSFVVNTRRRLDHFSDNPPLDYVQSARRASPERLLFF
jgi:hypothetical protein